MPPAIIAGGIAAAGTIGGSVLGASAQKKAAKTAAAAETNAANQNAALAREFRQENTANLSPWLQSGQRANALVDSFLYGPQQAQAAPQQPVAPIAGGSYGGEGVGDLGYIGGHTLAQRQPMNALAAQPAQAASPAPQAPANPMSGYEAFTNSPYYQFPLQEGMRQLNTGLASRGQINSGDAMKAAIRYGQDYGFSQGLMPYIGLVENQSNRGIQAGGAIAGVGVNALNSMTNSNNAIGQAGANRAIASGAANANMYAGIGQGLGTLAGSVFPASSYGGGTIPGASIGGAYLPPVSWGR